MRRFVRENSLTLAFLALFLASFIAQAFVGHAHHNHDQLAHREATMSMGRYVRSSAFLADVMENWQSEYLQLMAMTLGTIWLVQRGSPESKPPEKAGLSSDEEQKVGDHAAPDSPKAAQAGGLRARLYANSLAIITLVFWIGAWAAQLVTGRIQYNASQLDHHESTLTLWQYAGSSEFWNRTLQNWQSEFLSVASIVVFSIWLRQRGSTQSKPVGEPHVSTG